MRAVELAQRLAIEAESVARHLLPHGQRKGHEWVCGDVDGSDGNSLKVRLDGSKAGVWRDFATDTGGDLIGLWMATQTCDLRAACAEASKYLGITAARVEAAGAPRKPYATPTRDGVTKLTDPLLEWLRTVRKISEPTVRAYSVAARKGALMFPSIRDGQLVAAKYRAAPEKKFWTDADCEPALFGWQAIPTSARSVAIVEGELDALAMFEYGFPALSVPFGGGGAGKQAWIESEFDRLAIYDELFLALDNDDAGRQATAEIVRRLGRERCRIVKLPRKDANACLIDGISRDVIADAMREARTQDPESLKPATEFTDAVIREFQKQESGEIGIRLPWPKVGDRLVLRPGEVSVWFGINGHGKSEVAGHIAMDTMLQEFRVCVASLEFKPEKWLKRLVRQASAMAFPSVTQIRSVMRWFHDQLWVFNVTGTAKANEIIETCRYAAKRYDVRLFVIDNLAKCGIAEDDYNGQKGLIDGLTDMARETDVHVMLVAHAKKPAAGEEKPPEKHDLKGTGALADMVDTVVTVWRNKPKEVLVATGKADAEKRAEPDCFLICSKQRNGEEEPRVGLFFDKTSHQYLERADSVALAMCGLRGIAAEA